MIPGPFDVVTVPFPFSDLARSKRRPALVVSSRAFNRSAGASIFAMITSGTTRWPGTWRWITAPRVSLRRALCGSNYSRSTTA